MTSDGRRAAAHGLATIADQGPDAGLVLDTWFPDPRLGDEPGGVPDAVADADGARDELLGTRTEHVEVRIDLDAPITSTPDAYLRLHLLSTLLARPNTLELEGLYGHLPIVVFTTRGPMTAASHAAGRVSLRRAGVSSLGLDRFPQLLDYVVPDRVRIADASRVRLGAHLAPGTTVMQAGFVNFNAGTLGTSMVEGRISQGVLVGDGSDVGGGASIMGTLSGGGTQRVRIGERALLGANSGVGISIGDDCIVEAGLYVTAGTRVTLHATDGPREVKALELSGQPGLLFRRDSRSGAVEALPRTGQGITLNPMLHA